MGHIHEREVGHHCGLGSSGVAFMPHVAPFFQGIHLTVTGHVAGSSLPSSAAAGAAAFQEAYASFYAGQRLVTVLGPGLMPDVATHGSCQQGVTVGGFNWDPAAKRLSMVSCIDNLLKGAATQALQNINLALGLPEYQGIPM